MSEGAGWVKFEWFFDTVNRYKASLNFTEIGELFVRVMEYAETGKKVKVSASIFWPYGDQCERVDAYKKSYNKLHAARVEAGRAGGQAKARNAKAAQQDPAAAAVRPAADPPPEEPRETVYPSKKDVQDLFRELKEDGRIKSSAKLQDANAFYAEMEAQGWIIDGAPVHEKRVLRKVMFFRWSAYYSSREAAEMLQPYLAVVKALGGKDPTSCGIKHWDFLRDAYNKGTQTWTIGGTTYSTLDEAAEAFVANAGKA